MSKHLKKLLFLLVVLLPVISENKVTTLKFVVKMIYMDVLILDFVQMLVNQPI